MSLYSAFIGLLLIGGHGSFGAASDSSVTVPLTFNPSVFWDGDGGHWSTFALRIGTPPQTVRLVPSIGGDSINPIWIYACSQTYPDWDNCTDASGMTFSTSNSITYEQAGYYYLPLNTEANLDLGNFSSQLGFDNITLDYPGYSNISLSNASIFADLNDSFSIGTFGLFYNTTYVDSEYNNAIPTFLGSLRDANLIPSLSWGYLAGAVYRYGWPTRSYASLTLGGYDTSRMNATSGRLTLAGGEDPTRKFLLGINRIETNAGTVLLDDPITSVSLDSQVTSLWLPKSVCAAFEDAFGLVWNSTYSMYLMSDDEYTSLKELDPSITFTLSTGMSNDTDTLNITLPYGAFDLETTPPINGETFKYFPLNRSTDDSQYTLGRVILQEIYMLADYEQGFVSLWQGVYPDVSVSSELVAVCPVNSTTCKSTESGGNKLSHGAIAGTVVGTVVGGGAIITAAIFGCLWWRRKKKDQRKKNEEALMMEAAAAVAATASARDSVATFSGTAAGAGTVEKPELEGSTSPPRKDLDGFYSPHSRHRSELSGDSGYAWPSVLMGSGTAGTTTGGSSSNLRDSHSIGMVAESEMMTTRPDSSELQELEDGQDRQKRRSELSGSPMQQRFEMPGSMFWPSPELSES